LRLPGFKLFPPDEIIQQTTPPPTEIKPCSDSGFRPGPTLDNIDLPFVFPGPPLEIQPPTSIPGTFVGPVELPTILKMESLENEFGERIRVRKLSDREVRKMRLHREKAEQGFGARDIIYIDRDGQTWIRSVRGGPLILFP
jgi:hypothetical protein